MEKDNETTQTSEGKSDQWQQQKITLERMKEQTNTEYVPETPQQIQRTSTMTRSSATQ